MKSHWLWVNKGDDWIVTDRQFDWDDPADVGHQIRLLRDHLETEIIGKNSKKERVFDPMKVPVGFGADTKFQREFDAEELKTAEAARRKSLEVARRRRNYLPSVLPA